ncbi:MAG: ion transporter, partial [Nanoarchaeota archaeon]
LMMLQGIFLMLQNLMIFITPAAVVISLKIVFEYASESDKNLEWEMPSPKDRHYGENLWDMIVFVSVAFVLVILVLESFFNLEPYPGLVSLLTFIDYMIVGIFVIDLFVIYNKVRNVKLFLMRNWIDILAVIPFGSVFRLTKLVRVVRIMRVFSGAQKASKVNRISKFFSDDSGFNKLLVRDKNDSGKKSKKSGKKTTKARKK